MSRSSEWVRANTGWPEADREPQRFPRDLRISLRSSSGRLTEQVVSRPFDHCSGPLPSRLAILHTQGGLLCFYCAGSTWVLPEASAETRVGLEVWMDGKKVGEASTRAARRGLLCFDARFTLRQIPGGNHTIKLRPLGQTRTREGDLFHLAVVEFRQVPHEEAKAPAKMPNAGMDRPALAVD